MLQQRDTDKVKRSENKVNKYCSRLNYSRPTSLPAFFFPLLARSLPHCLRFSYLSSNVRSSSMVSFAEVVSLRVQRRKSDGHVLPTRSPRWTRRYEAPSLSQTTLTPSEPMVQGFFLRPSNATQLTRRQDHHPPLPSLQTNNSLNSLRLQLLPLH